MPEEKIIQFGDMTFAIFIDAKSPTLSREREEVIPICMKPRPRLIREKNITKEELDEEDVHVYGKKPKGSVWREYPKHWVEWIRLDWLFIWCDFDCKSTHFTEKMGGLGDKITELNILIEAYRDSNLNLAEQYWSLLAQREEDEKRRKQLEDIRTSPQKTEGEGGEDSGKETPK